MTIFLLINAELRIKNSIFNLYLTMYFVITITYFKYNCYVFYIIIKKWYNSKSKGGEIYGKFIISIIRGLFALLYSTQNYKWGEGLNFK